MPRKKSPAQLQREIDAVLVKPKMGGMESVTKSRVDEALMGEQIVRRQPIDVTVSGIREPWDLIFTTGKNIGGAKAGRILVVLPKGDTQDPLAGLAYAIENGRPYVHHVWVDSDARDQGLSRALFDAFRAQVSPNLVVVGPFTKAGRAAAESAGATIED
jgi:hypothetical protein